MRAPSRVRALTASLVLTGVLAACSSSGSTGSGYLTPTSGTPSPPASASSSAADQTSTVMTTSTSLGTILVDGRGMTLYLFTKDTQNSGKSACEGQCLAAWPPLLGEPQAGAGADKALLGTLVRTDGTTQVTYD
jgi:predicted lipoprotein with Yx(FWY)xxD motif